MTSEDQTKYNWLAAVAGVSATLVALAVFGSFDSPWTLRGDNKAVMFPLNLEAYRQWTSGYAPEWSDGFWSGLPLLADPTSMSLYWPNFLAFLLTPEPHLRAYDLTTALHAGILVSGTITLLRILGTSASASLFGGILIFAAPMHVWYASAMITGYGPVVWWPWMLVAAEMLSRNGPVLRYYCLGWLALASCAVIYPEFAFYGGVVCSCWLVTRRTGLTVPTRLFRAAVLGLGGVALAAPQLLPTVLLLPDTTRGSEGPGDLDFAVSVFQADRLLYPSVAEKIPSFIGVATVLLALRGFTSRRPRSMFLGAVALVTYLVAIGSPLHDLIHSLPIFDIFRQPMKFKLLSEMALALLAALGLDYLLANNSDRGDRLFILLLAFMVVGENLAYLGQRVPTGFRLPGNTDTSFSELYDQLTTSGIVHLTPARPNPSSRVSETVGLRGIPMIHDAPVIAGGPNALLPRRHRRIIAALNSAPGPTRRELTHFGAGFHLTPRPEPNRKVANPCLDVAEDHDLLLVGVHNETCLYMNPDQPERYEVAKKAIHSNSHEEMIDELERKLRGERTVLTAKYQDDWCPIAEANSTQAAIVVIQHTVNDEVQVVAPMTEVAQRRRGAGKVEIREYRPGNIELNVSAEKRAFLIARESLYDGWRAFVNGKSVPIYPAAGLFFAVPVPDGASVVSLRYRSPGLRAGVQIALGWIALVCLAALAYRVIVERKRGIRQSGAPLPQSF